MEAGAWTNALARMTDDSKARIEGSLRRAVGAITAQCPDPWPFQGDFGGRGAGDSAGGSASFTVQLHSGSTLMAATQQEPVQD
jgi:hypothetical protein